MNSKQFIVRKKSKIKRKLLSIKDCINIAIKKKIINSQRKNQFKWFIHYLIERSGFLPIYQIGNNDESKESEKKYFFHPLQFLEIINIYSQIFRKKIYYTEDEEFETYLFTKEKEHKLKELNSIIEKIDNSEDIYKFYDKEALSQSIEEWKNREFQYKHQYSLDILTDIKRITRFSFNQEQLATWMKLEEFFPEIQCLTRMSYENQASKEDYKVWRDGINIQAYFNKEELSHLKSYLEYFREIIRSLSNNVEKISDLLEYCPWNDFKDILWYSSQLIMLERTLVRVMYIITGNNYSSSNKIIKGKPDYYHEEEKDQKDWLTSVLIHRNLLIKPLKIIVEGKTESDLLIEYKKVHWQDRWADIIKEGGIKNTLNYKRFFSSLDFDYYWYLLDYDEGQHKVYENIRMITWFFPDFVTEVFTVEQAFRAYKDFILSKNLGFKKIFHEEKMMEDLNKIKKNSDKMIREYPNIQTSCIGYEEYLIGQSFDKIEIRKKVFFGYDKYQTSYQDLGNKTKKIFRKIFKKEYGKCLLCYFINVDEKGVVRNEIFDKKMKDAFSFFNSITNRKFRSFLNH